MIFTPAANGLDLIATNKVRPLAISGLQRFPTLPDVPTFAEAGLPQFVYDAWFGVLAPTGTSAAIVQKLNGDIRAVLNMPDVKELLARQGVTPTASSSREFSALVKADAARFNDLLPANRN